MNGFTPFGVCTVLLFLVYLTSCRGAPDTTTQANTTVTTESSGTSASPIVQVGNCSDQKTNDTCCKTPGCSWVVCLNPTASVNHTGCHNLSDPTDKRNASLECKVNATKIAENVTCTFKPNTTTTTPAPTTASPAPTISPAPMAGTCEALTNQTDCCGPDGLKLKCLYVNCTTQNPKGTTMCLNATSMASKCSSAAVICNSSESGTTPAPTSTPSPTTTTSAPNTTTKAPPPTTLAPHTGTTEHGQHFDGASFIGGMILMAGLVIIGFFAFKFYRSHKDRSYRTL